MKIPKISLLVLGTCVSISLCLGAPALAKGDSEDGPAKSEEEKKEKRSPGADPREGKGEKKDENKGAEKDKKRAEPPRRMNVPPPPPPPIPGLPLG
jgi:hypothetical protein